MITASNLRKINYQETASIIVLPYINRQSIIAQSIIVSMQISFAASESTQAIILYLFCMGRLFTDLYLIHFQTMSGNARAYMSSWLSHGGAGGQQDSQLLSLFLLYNS